MRCICISYEVYLHFSKIGQWSHSEDHPATRDCLRTAFSCESESRFAVADPQGWIPASFCTAAVCTCVSSIKTRLAPDGLRPEGQVVKALLYKRAVAFRYILVAFSNPSYAYGTSLPMKPGTSHGTRRPDKAWQVSVGDSSLPPICRVRCSGGSCKALRSVCEVVQ